VQTRYPTASDLRELLKPGGDIDPSPLQNIAVQAGIEYVENQAQRHFLAGYETDNTQKPNGGAETRYFDPVTVREGRMDFGPYGDLVGVPDETITVAYQPPTGSPTTINYGKQYRIEPVNAPSRKRPYTWLRMVSYWWNPAAIANWDSLAITGLWGHWTSIPDDAYMAMVIAGALTVFGILKTNLDIPIGVKAWTAPGGVSTTFDTAWVTGQRAMWQETVANAVQQYARWSL
jgi:drug/metabolite transporter superfamily protein YnfA